MKVLILGSTGMLGHQVYFNLKRNKLDVFDVSFRNKLNSSTFVCDVSDFKKLSAIIDKINPRIIINCVGVLIKGSSVNPQNAILLNSFLPHWLCEKSNSINAKLIHISTDCVFSGSKGMYTEHDFRDADDTYGRSKALGEINSDKHLTLRTSIIGPELKSNGEGLMHWLFSQKNEVYGFTDAYWSGVTTTELSRVISELLESDLAGIINVTNNEKISKYDLLKLIAYTFNLSVQITPYEGKKADKSLVSTRGYGIFKVRTYERMMQDMYNWFEGNASLYPHYDLF